MEAGKPIIESNQFLILKVSLKGLMELYLLMDKQVLERHSQCKDLISKILRCKELFQGWWELYFQKLKIHQKMWSLQSKWAWLKFIWKKCEICLTQQSRTCKSNRINFEEYLSLMSLKDILLVKMRLLILWK